MRVRGCVSRISEATEIVYRGLSRSNPGSSTPIERALTEVLGVPMKPPGFVGLLPGVPAKPSGFVGWFPGVLGVPVKPRGFEGYSFFSQPALHAAGKVRRRGLALDQVLERSQLETPLHELLLAVVRQDHHRNVSRLLPAAKPLQDGETIHLW